MIGLVIVSHSRRLADGVAELAGQMGQGRARIAVAAGTTDPKFPLGTDALEVLAAIEAVYSEDGVLVLMDLGSAVLSAGTAMDFLAEDRRGRVRLCSGPLVEGAVAAATLAAAGADLSEVAREAENALAAKAGQLGRDTAQTARGGAGEAQEQKRVTVSNEAGLHARPAARLIRIARSFEARVAISNMTANAGPADAASINALLGLGARKGHQLSIAATGPEAAGAVAAVASFIESGCGERQLATASLSVPAMQAQARPGELPGIAASPGVATGPLVKFRPIPPPIEDRSVADAHAEWERLTQAIRSAQNETRTMYEWAAASIGQEEAAIFDAQLLFLEDPALVDIASRLVRDEHHSAEFAWSTAARLLTDRLAELDDPYLRARAADVADIANRVLRMLAGSAAVPLILPERSIVSAHDLTPSEVHTMDPELVAGLCLETGSATAHSVILARAMGIPVVAGLGPAISAVPDGTTVAVDGDRGVVVLSPGPEATALIEDHRKSWLAARQAAQLERDRPACTSDGHRIRVLANLNRDSDVLEALNAGAEGVGVLRTEFLFVGRDSAPTEEEQSTAYRTIAEALGDRPLVIRTLDIGGDKRVPFVDSGDESNPFLGWRGIRVSLTRRDLLRTQLRAILRAGRGFAVEVLLPMISALAELRSVKAFLGEMENELRSEGVPFHEGMKIGAMIEVPSAVAIAGDLAREANRLSIGSNDLVQYVMAADRTNARVAKLADHFQPAVLRMIRETVRTGRNEGVCVDVCGEMAADPLATPLLIGMGLEELSISAAAIPELKQAIRRWNTVEAGEILEEALAQDSADAVRGLLLQRLKARER